MGCRRKNSQEENYAFDSLSGYWYRISWSADLNNTDTDVRIFYVAIISFPEILPAYKGVIEFKGRAMFWGDPQFPNRLRFSTAVKPDSIEQDSQSYTAEFGNMTEIVRLDFITNS